MEGHRMAKRLTIYNDKYRGLQADQHGDDSAKVMFKSRMTVA